MAGARLIVLYPRPTHINVFEKLYQEEHVPMTVKNLVGKTKLVASLVESPTFYRMAEIHCPSMEVLGACAATAETQATFAHAERISTGGKPTFVIAEEHTVTF